MYKILLLEDDELFAQTLEDFLEEENFHVDLVKDGEQALSFHYENHYDLYLLDINVPKINGLDCLKYLRQTGDKTAAIYLTSYKDKEILKNGFLCGCDDYIKKPVDLDELLLRITSLLKRCGKKMNKITLFDNLVFDPITKRLFKNSIDLNVTTKIVSLLELFLENKHSIITKDMIINRLWNTCEEHSEGSIRVYINSLKKILGKGRITNIRGVGYKLEY